MTSESMTEIPNIQNMNPRYTVLYEFDFDGCPMSKGVHPFVHSRFHLRQSCLKLSWLRIDADVTAAAGESTALARLFGEAVEDLEAGLSGNEQCIYNIAGMVETRIHDVSNVGCRRAVKTQTG